MSVTVPKSPATASAASGSARSGWSERAWFALGSDAVCQLRGGPDGLIDTVIPRVEEFEASWSRFRADSDLSALNADPAPAVGVPPLLALALDRACDAWQRTDGWYDPTVIGSLEHAGYTGSLPGPERRGRLGRCVPAPGLADVVVDVAAGIVERPPGVRFDLGGIGKGLAADLLVEELLAAGAEQVCVGMGGDVRVGGVAPEGGWRIPVEDPRRAPAHRAGDVWFDAVLDGGAIVTSTTRFRTWITADGVAAHHLIDPFTGRPSMSPVRAVVVAAGAASWAEVVAKAALLAGPELGRELAARADVTAWFVEDDYRGAAA